MSEPQIFLSYSRESKEAVLAVRTVLRARGFSTFLDIDNLVAGIPWPQALEQSLGGVLAVVVFIGRQLGGWQKREIWYALDRQVGEERHGRAFPVIPVLLPGADSAAGFLFSNTWVDLRDGYDGMAAAEAMDAIARAIRATVPATVALDHSDLCPYRGLQAFREEDAAFFGGRAAFAERLFNFVTREGLVAVVGPSGSGKSSVVQAGLLPLLRRQRPPAKTWDAVTFTPGNDPSYRLAAALMPLLEPHLGETDRLTESQKLGERFASGEVKLDAVIDRIIEKSNGTSRLLVVADQFEEIFTIAPEPVQRPFAQMLLRSVGCAPFTLLLTLRADFYSQVIDLDRGLSERIASAQVNIGALTIDELRESIGTPARLVGLEFEPGLVERLLADVGSEPGFLPLLEFALTEVWQRRQGRKLTNQAYNEIEGIAGALAQRAEAEFARFGPDEKVAARRLFSRLVRVSRPNEGTEDARQRIELQLNDAKTVSVAQAFALPDIRLLVTGRDEQTGHQVVEVAHEALIRNWERLRGWLNEDREFLLWRQRVEIQVEEWRRAGRDVGYLLRGAPLSEAERWLARRPDDLGDDDVRAYVSASAAWRDAENRKNSRIKRLLLAAAAIAILIISWEWWKANVSLDLANHNYLLAVRVAADTSDVVQKQLLPNGKMQSKSILAKNLLESPLRTFNGIQGQEKPEAALSRLKLFELLWNNYFILNDWPRASTAAQAEFKLAEQWEKTDASRPDWLSYMVRARENEGDDARKADDFKSAESHFSQAVGFAKRLSDRFSGAAWKNELARAHERLGDALRGQRRFDEALNEFQLFLNLAVSVPDADEDSKLQRNRAVVHGKIGDMLLAQNKLDGAEREYRTNLEISEGLAKPVPQNADFVRGVGVAHERLGFVRRLRGRFVDAIQDYELELGLIGTLLQTETANHFWRRDEALANEGLGDVYRDAKDYTAALSHYSDFLKIVEALQVTSPQDAQLRRDVAVAHQRLGSVKFALHRNAEASEEFKRCLASAEGASTFFDPRNPEPLDVGRDCRERLDGLRLPQ